MTADRKAVVGSPSQISLLYIQVYIDLDLSACLSACLPVCLCKHAGVKGMLDKIGGEIVGFSKMFPVEASLANFTVYLNEQQKIIEAYYPQLDQMDFYRSAAD